MQCAQVEWATRFHCAHGRNEVQPITMMPLTTTMITMRSAPITLLLRPSIATSYGLAYRLSGLACNWVPAFKLAESESIHCATLLDEIKIIATLIIIDVFITKYLYLTAQCDKESRSSGSQLEAAAVRSSPVARDCAPS